MSVQTHKRMYQFLSQLQNVKPTDEPKVQSTESNECARIVCVRAFTPKCTACSVVIIAMLPWRIVFGKHLAGVTERVSCLLNYVIGFKLSA